MNKAKQWLKEHWYIFLLLWVPIYLPIFFYLELKIPLTGYYSTYCKLDDYIPFICYFYIPYVSWYLNLAVFGLWFLFKDKVAFIRFMAVWIITFIVCLTICAVFPNGQDLRPYEMLDEHCIFCRFVQGLYNVDTNTNVLPSMHVVGVFPALMSTLTSKSIRSNWIKAGEIIWAVLIAASTVLIKQHSIVDVFAALILAAVVVPLIYAIKWERIFTRKPNNNVEIEPSGLADTDTTVNETESYDSESFIESAVQNDGVLASEMEGE